MRTVLSNGFTGGTAGVGEGTEGVAMVGVTAGVALFRVASGVAVGGKIAGSRSTAGVATEDGSHSLRSAKIFFAMKLNWYGVMISIISGITKVANVILQIFGF